MSDFGYLALGLGLLAVYLVAMAAMLFGGAGTLAVPMFWAYLALFAIFCLGASAALYLLSPDLVRERVRPGTGEQDRRRRPARSWAGRGEDGCVTGGRDRQPEVTRSVADSDTATCRSWGAAKGTRAAYDNACPIRDQVSFHISFLALYSSS